MSMSAPLAVWDVREDRWWDKQPARRDWLKAAGLTVGKTYRIEFRLLDTPFARIFCYALNEAGRPYWLPCHTPGQLHDHDACDVAREEPRDIVLDAPPPRELW
jgi:hypothetical protein